MNPSIKVIWRLFGGELYDLHKEEFLEIESLKYSQKKNDNFVKKNINIIKNILKWKYVKKKYDIRDYYSRISGVICLNKLEYNLLKYYEPDLPKFIQNPFRKKLYFDLDIEINKKPNNFVIGANRHPLNNHIDLIYKLTKENNLYNYKFNLLFNYGGVNDYTQKVKEILSDNDSFNLIEKFIATGDYYKMVNDNVGIIVNSLRENGMASLFFALRHGLKVYLNKKGIMFKFLKADGFIIHSVEDLTNEIKNSCDIVFDKNEAEHNISIYQSLCEKNSIKKFHKDIDMILK